MTFLGHLVPKFECRTSLLLYFRLVAFYVGCLVDLVFFKKLWKMGWLPKGWGEYPPEYNREIHGPYNPSTYYGKRDTPFGDVKIGELLPWLSRRRKSPRAMAQAISRAFMGFYLKWMFVKKPGAIGIYQVSALTIALNYIVGYDRIRNHRSYRYH